MISRKKQMQIYIFISSKSGTKAKKIHEDLKIVFGECTYSIDRIYKLIGKYEEFNSFDEIYRKKKKRKIKSLEVIDQLLDENPSFSLRNLSKQSGIPKSTIYNYLINDLEYRYFNYEWVPKILSSDQKKSRVEISKNLLNILSNENKNTFYRIITGDETWLNYYYPEKGYWSKEKDKTKLNENKKLIKKKIMITVFISSHGLISFDSLPEKQTFTSNYFMENILPNVELGISKTRKKARKREIFLHFDNSRCHTTNKVSEKIKELGFKKAQHPLYSPDPAPCDYWLFGYLKENLKGKKFETKEELLEFARNFLKNIPKKMYYNAYNEWKKRLDSVIENNGEYI